MQIDKKTRRLRTDNGGEFINKQMQELLDQEGIVHEKTPPRTPQANGLAERGNHTLLEVVRTVPASGGLPATPWAELANEAVYLRNRIAARVLG